MNALVNVCAHRSRNQRGNGRFENFSKNTNKQDKQKKQQQ